MLTVDLHNLYITHTKLLDVYNYITHITLCVCVCVCGVVWCSVVWCVVCVCVCLFTHACFVFSVNYVILCVFVCNEHPQSKFSYFYEDNKVLLFCFILGYF